MKRIAILPCPGHLAAGLVGAAPTTSWPTYHGDNTGRRFSPLTGINDKNVGGLATAWSFRTGAGGSLKSTPLMVDGILYLTAPDHVWAVDARNGKEILAQGLRNERRLAHRQPRRRHFRQLAFLPDTRLPDHFFEPQGRVRALAETELRPRPVLLRLDGSDDRQEQSDCRRLGRRSRPPRLSHRVRPRDWRPEVALVGGPSQEGGSGSETWPNEEAMRHGGGMTWQMPTYDPDLNLIYITTGNPQPVIAHANRKGDNLYTGCDRRAECRHRKDGLVFPGIGP